MSDVEIRLAKVEELKAVQDLNHELFLLDARYFDDLNVEWPYESVGEKCFQQMIAGEIGVCLVAEANGQIVGYLAGCTQKPNVAYRGKRAELENMFVSPEWRSRGVGSKLVRAFFEWCK